MVKTPHFVIDDMITVEDNVIVIQPFRRRTTFKEFRKKMWGELPDHKPIPYKSSEECYEEGEWE